MKYGFIVIFSASHNFHKYSYFPEELEDLTAGLHGPPGLPGQGRPGKNGRPGPPGPPGDEANSVWFIYN